MKVSVLMSIYNGEKFLREAMESVLSQTFTDFEFLIINDASTDQSREIVLSYHDPRIRLVENATNLGLTKSLNIGLKMAQGEFVARMDSDDVSLPERLEKQVAFLEKNPDVALVGSSFEIINSKGVVTYTPKKHYFIPEEIFYNLTFHNTLPHSSATMRKAKIIAIGGYNEKFKRSQDFDLWYRLSRIEKIIRLEETLLQWRTSAENISTQNKAEQSTDARNIFLTHLQAITGISDDIAKDIICFHNEKHIGIKNIIAVIKFQKKLCQKIPAYIDKNALRKICRKKIIWYVKEMTMNTYIIMILKNFKRFLTKKRSGLNFSADSLSPKVTVLMPVYNTEKYLHEAIESILKQTFKNFELLIIDDCSTDGSARIIQSFNDSRIRMIKNEKNIGLIATLNKGMDISRGEFIARMDSDDISIASRLEEQVRFMEASPEIGIVGTWLKTFGCESSVWPSPEKHAEIHSRELFYPGIHHATVMFRRELFAKYNLKYDSHYLHCEDYELWTRAIKYIRFANIPRVLYLYLRHANQTCTNSNSVQNENANNIRIKQIKELGIAPTEEEAKLHENIARWTFGKEKDFIEKTEKWLIKILVANNTRNVYDANTLKKTFFDRWLAICEFNAGFGFWSWKKFTHSPLYIKDAMTPKKKLKFFIKYLIASMRKI